jgi:uncharacterized protein
MHHEAVNLIKKLDLKPHPEGGYYREIYRSGEIIPGKSLPERYKEKDHSFATSIYFLLEGEQLSKLHRLQSDEQWHFYAGSGAFIYIINESGNLNSEVIGSSINEGEVLQVMIKHHNWFCAEVKDKNSFVLVGCTVSPGFEFDDFELGERNKLITMFPDQKELIVRFT